MTDSEPRDKSRALRVVAIALSVAALAVLVAIRVTGADGSADATATTLPLPGSATTTTAEPPLDDPPSRVTSRRLGGIKFTDVTKEAGLDAIQSTLKLTRDDSMTSGAAVADVNGDGRPDVYVTRVGLPNSLYRNNGDGTFSDIAVPAGVAERPGGGFQGSAAAAFGDINGDGCPDLYVGGEGSQEPGDPPPDPTAPPTTPRVQPISAGLAALYVNDCHGHFTDETATSGLALPAPTQPRGAHDHGVAFTDYDHDGHLDVLVLNWDTAFLAGKAAGKAYESDPNPTTLCNRTKRVIANGADRAEGADANRSHLFHNDGTGHFSEVTSDVGLKFDHIAAFTGDFVDVNGDGWQDLLVAGDFCTSHLFLNDHGKRFTDVTAKAGVATDENGMGSVVRDLNGDGRPDWFVTAISMRTKSGKCGTRAGNQGCSGNRLYLNAGNGTFKDATDAAGLRNGWWGWGAAIEDFGDDGRLEVAQTNGYIGTEAPRDRFITDPFRFWVPDSAPKPGSLPHFAEAAKLVGLGNTAVGHAVIPFDYDGDGDLDLLVTNFGAAPILYRNDRPAGRHWLTVRLDDPTRPGNRAGLGAKVRITPTDRPPITGWISSGGSYESSRLPELHVGFGGEEPPSTVEVWWPGETSPQTVRDVTVDQVFTVTRAAGS